MEHLSGDVLTRYRTGNLAGAPLLEADDHLSVCPDCREKLSGQTESGALLQPFRLGLDEETPHLPYEQLAAYVDAALPALAVPQIEAHLANCSNCRAEVDDLKKWALDLNTKHARKPIRKLLLAFIAVAAAIVGAIVVTWQSHNAQPKLLLSLRDGGSVIGIDAKGAMDAPATLSPEDESLLAGVLHSGELTVQQAPGLETHRSQLLGTATPRHSLFAPLSPVGYSVLEVSPTLHWQALPKATSYQVKIFDADYKLIETSEALQSTSWTVSSPLERGKIYSWQIVASVNHETVVAPQIPDPEARFLVLDAAATSDLQDMSKALAGNHLLLAAKYAAHGLCHETSLELQALKNANPLSPTVVEIQRSVERNCPAFRNE